MTPVRGLGLSVKASVPTVQTAAPRDCTNLINI